MSAYMELRNISKQFSGQMVLDGISLTIEKGTTIGLVGENGSGKSVLFKILCGFVKPDQGQVYVQGKQLGQKDDFPENMGVLINSPGFIGIYSGYKNLEFLANIRGVISEREIKEAMKKVGLDPANKTKVDNYSLGMKQKLGLAQAIMENQDILVLDEPFNALDFKTYNDIKEIIRILQAEGKTILLTSHNYDDVEQLCNTVFMIDDGKLLELTSELAKKYLGRK
ncbi:MAG: ABC transporter ATP-binding protein [Ruminiclostridium sp.]